MIDEHILNDKAKFYAKTLWGRELNIPIRINKRLKSTLGQYCHTHIDISALILHEDELVDDTLLHELCHWHCHTSGQNYDDHTKDFEDELESVGASSTHSTQHIGGKWLFLYRYGCYECKSCGSKRETKDYRDGKSAHGGWHIKKLLCCSMPMQFLGIKQIPEKYMPNEKVRTLIEQYEVNLKERGGLHVAGHLS
jgi:SprT-like protein